MRVLGCPSLLLAAVSVCASCVRVCLFPWELGTHTPPLRVNGAQTMLDGNPKLVSTPLLRAQAMVSYWKQQLVLRDPNTYCSRHDHVDAHARSFAHAHAHTHSFAVADAHADALLGAVLVVFVAHVLMRMHPLTVSLKRRRSLLPSLQVGYCFSA